MSSPISSIQLFVCHLHAECERMKRKQSEWKKRKRERNRERDGGLVAANPSSGPFKYLNVHARCAYSFCLSFSFVQLFTYFFPMPTCHNILFLNSIGPSSGTKTTHGNGKRHDEEDSEENQFNDWHRWWIFQYTHFPYIAYDVAVCYAVRKRNKCNFLNYVYRYTVCYVLWRLVLRIKWKILSSVNTETIRTWIKGNEFFFILFSSDFFRLVQHTCGRRFYCYCFFLYFDYVRVIAASAVTFYFLCLWRAYDDDDDGVCCVKNIPTLIFFFVFVIFVAAHLPGEFACVGFALLIFYRRLISSSDFIFPQRQIILFSDHNSAQRKFEFITINGRKTRKTLHRMHGNNELDFNEIWNDRCSDPGASIHYLFFSTIRFDPKKKLPANSFSCFDKPQSCR